MHDVAAARKAVQPITAQELQAILGHEDVLVVDVRDAPELIATGKIPGALNVSRGTLEFQADDTMPTHNAAFVRDKTVVVYCASGARAALCGRALQDLGYPNVRNLGSLKAWTDAGGAVESD